jgi:hypothetical protein
METERTPLSDLERLAKLAENVRNGEVTEGEAITFLATNIVGRSPHLPRITGDQIESLSRMISGYFLWCRHVGTAAEWVEDGPDGRVSRSRGIPSWMQGRI